MTTTEAAQPLLSARAIAKSYGPIRALSSVDLDVFRGEIHAICGENGAGKSTLMKVLAGSAQPDLGTITLAGRPYHPRNPSDATDAGIGIVYQERSLMPNISVAENICLATPGMGRGAFVDSSLMRRRATELLATVGGGIDINERVGALSIARQQLVEIAKALARGANILILDEPTSSIGAQAARALFVRLRRLRDDGLAIVYISHHLDEVFQIADRITVLRDGQGRGTWPASDLGERELVSLMVGREYSHDRERRTTENLATSPILSVKALSRRREFVDVDLDVHSGEIVALTGLVGAGRTELAETIFGIRTPDSGQVFLSGAPIPSGNPGQAIYRGLCMLTEDRKVGLYPSMSVRANVVAPSLRHFGSRTGFDDRRARELAEQYVRELSIKVKSVDDPVGSLSGGNQQKVLFAMWLATKPKVLVVDEPTKGIDVAAKDDVHNLLLGLAKGGVGILLISSDQAEVHRLADRILVMRRGMLVAELRGDASDEDVVARAAGAGA